VGDAFDFDRPCRLLSRKNRNSRAFFVPHGVVTLDIRTAWTLVTFMADENRSNLTPEQMAARIAELEGRLAKGSSISFKVSEKGAVSVYGLGRFPVTLYLEQWTKLLSHIDELKAFIEANKSRLKTKT
jgi:hypothetical protein